MEAVQGQERGRGRQICPCGQGCAPSSQSYRDHLKTYQRQQKAAWQRAKRAEERAELLKSIGAEETAAHPGYSRMGQPLKGVTRRCYCGCGAEAGSVEYVRHYNTRYEKLRMIREVGRNRRIVTVPIYQAWRGN
jgi:hypothetical protein